MSMKCDCALVLHLSCSFPAAAPVTTPPPPPEHLFSTSMTDDEFLDLLKRKGYPEKDCSKLTGNWNPQMCVCLHCTFTIINPDHRCVVELCVVMSPD